MKVNEVEDLLARYYNGDTSEAEEKELKRFFAGEDVPSHLLADKEFFLQLTACPEQEVPQGLEAKLSNLIDEWDAHEKRVQKVNKPKRVIRLQWMASIAASLLILFSVGMYVCDSQATSTPEDTCATPEEAYAQAQKALVMLSASLNKGMEEVETVQKTTNKIRENVYQQLNRLNNINQ